MDAVATGFRAHGEENVADAVRPRRRKIGFPQQPDRHRIDQRIAGVAWRKADFASEGRNADAVTLVTHALDDAGEQIAVTCVIEGPEPQRVEHRHRAGAHGEDVAQDPAHAGGGALIWFDGTRVIVRLDLERHRPSFRQPKYAGVLTGTLDHLRAVNRKSPQHRLGVLVGAVLRPQGGKDAQLGQGRDSLQQGNDGTVLGRVELVLPHDLVGDLPLARERFGDGHGRHAATSTGAERTSELENRCPASAPSTRSARRSGCGMNPTTVPAALQIPAMSFTEPLGLWGRSEPATGTYRSSTRCSASSAASVAGSAT